MFEQRSRNDAPILQLRGITKSYPTVLANDSVDLEIFPGQIHAVLGENGAGKSTLMKVIYGSTQPDSGEILWQQEKRTVRNPAFARSLGIGMVFQHFSLFETLTVAQNISLAVPGKMEDLSTRIVDIGRKFGLEVAPDTLVYSLSVGERQRVEIIRCILQSPKLLILDEPTSVLPPQGIHELFKTLRQLAGTGCAIVYISHKLDEIRALCDEATILRHGRVVDTVDPRSTSTSSLARMMIGGEIPMSEKSNHKNESEVLLKIDSLNFASADPYGVSLEDIGLQVNAGEVVGIAGVSGNGQSELMQLISGEQRFASEQQGDLLFESEAIGHLDPAERRALGLNFVPEERLGRGAVPPMPLSDNTLLTGFGRGMVQRQLIARKEVNAAAKNCIDAHDVRCGGFSAVAKSLSGGNLQKFIVGRELSMTPKLLVVSQPTWGVDVGAAANIRRQLLLLAERGSGVLLVSEELDELFEITDTLYVAYRGRLSEPMLTQEVDRLTIGRMMTGLGTTEERAAS
ncbi:MAG: ABC transporter ATP-binding protein [Arenicellales bacterium]